MSERFENDQMLDEFIGEALPELPPDDIAREVTPWRKSMGRVLTGMVLVTVQFNFLLLQYIFTDQEQDLEHTAFASGLGKILIAAINLTDLLKMLTIERDIDLVL